MTPRRRHIAVEERMHGPLRAASGTIPARQHMKQALGRRAFHRVTDGQIHDGGYRNKCCCVSRHATLDSYIRPAQLLAIPMGIPTIAQTMEMMRSHSVAVDMLLAPA